MEIGKNYDLVFQPFQNVRVRVEIVYTGVLTQGVFQKTIDHLRLDMDGFAKEMGEGLETLREMLEESEEHDAI